MAVRQMKLREKQTLTEQERADSTNPKRLIRATTVYKAKETNRSLWIHSASSPLFHFHFPLRIYLFSLTSTPSTCTHGSSLCQVVPGSLYIDNTATLESIHRCLTQQ